MKMTYAKVLEGALALGKNERRKLYAELGLSIAPSKKAESNGKHDDDESLLMRPDMTDDEFDAELRRRIEEAERDPSVMISWEEAEKGWRKLLK